jgi:hypothetical protein
MPLYLALDIEKKDNAYGRGLFAVAFVLTDAQFELLDVFAISMRDVPFTDPDTESFWAGHPAILDRLESQGVPREDAFERIRQFVASVAARNERVIVVSDNPAYDVAHLDIEVGFNLRYAVNGGRYGPVNDADGMYRGARAVLGPSDVARLKSSVETNRIAFTRALGIPPDDKHDPLVDVAGILAQYKAVCTFVCGRDEARVPEAE